MRLSDGVFLHLPTYSRDLLRAGDMRGKVVLLQVLWVLMV